MSWTFSNPISAVKSDTPHRNGRDQSAAYQHTRYAPEGSIGRHYGA